MDLETRLRTLWPPDGWLDLTMLVAVSGGADSVALLRALHAVRAPGPGRLVVAHFNHALRNEADDDETFVRQLAASLGLECAVGQADRPPGKPRPTSRIEEAARRVRYDFLRATAAQIGARYVATAHTADDQAETVLHRIVRGTGVAGLAGMRRARPLSDGVTLVRPLLAVRRAELTVYLAEIGQPFREDATNAERRFTRNRLRHELLPQLAEQYNPNVADALVRLSQLAGEAQDIVDKLVADLLRRAVQFQGGLVLFDRSRLSEEPRYLVREVLVTAWRRQGWPEQAMGFAEWESLADLLLGPETKSAPTSRMLPGGITVQSQPGTMLMKRTA